MDDRDGVVPSATTAPALPSLRWPALDWMMVACACLALALYANTLHHGWALDDYPTIYGNRLTMSGFRGIPTMLRTGYWYGLDGMNDWLYRPLSLVMFAVEWQVSRGSPAIGHWVNVALYALTACALYRFLRELFDTYHFAVPLAITLLWIAHPLHTEVVANIKSRDELLAFLFSILTLSACLRYARAPRTALLARIGLCFFLALMSKESPITLLVIAPLTLYVFGRTDTRTIVRATIPLVIAAIVYLTIRGAVLTSQTGSTSGISLIDNSLVAAPDFLHRQATAFYILGMYLRMLVFPHPMSSDYSYRQVPVVGFGNPLALGALVAYVALAVYAIVRLRRRDPVAYGILFYLGGIALVANVLFMTRSTMAERFLFTPSLGFCIVLVILLARGTRLDTAPANMARGAPVAFAAPVILLLAAGAALTLARNPDWKNDTTLFSADSRNSPNSARIHFLYGNHLVQELKQASVPLDRQQDATIALAEFRRAIALYPAYAEPHMGIGDALTVMQDFPAATQWYQQIVARNPRFAAGWLALGNTYVRAGNHPAAIAAFQHAVGVAPDDAAANYLLGSAYQSVADSAQANRYLNRAYAIDPRLRR